MPTRPGRFTASHHPASGYLHLFPVRLSVTQTVGTPVWALTGSRTEVTHHALQHVRNGSTPAILSNGNIFGKLMLHDLHSFHGQLNTPGPLENLTIIDELKT